MKECDLQRWAKYLTLLTTLLFSGCTTSMRMSSDELKDLSPNEGIVIGSAQIKGGRDLIGRTKWEIVAKEIKDASPLSFLASSDFTFSIQAHREGDEEFFVTKMPAGNYSFWKLYQPGFSTFTAPISVQFRVEPGKTKYIGRLYIEFPPELLTSFTAFKITIEDTKESALDVVKKRDGIAATEVVTGLMTSQGRTGCLSGVFSGAGQQPSQRVEIPCKAQ